MAEHDLFEARLRAALVRHVADGPTDFDALGFARQVAAKEPRRRGLSAALAWRPVAVPRLAWALLATGLLLALVAGSVMVGARRPDHAVVIAPSPTPSATATTAPDEGTDILATTKARRLPAQATCPPGSSPDAPGPADQERPLAHPWIAPDAAMAFDRHAGRIVLLAYADDYRIVQRNPYVFGARTWTFDVCANTWQRMRPAEEPPDADGGLVYDADSDRTIAITSDGRFWSYDLAADRWTKGGWFPETRRGTHFGTGAVYHDPSGLVFIYHGARMWAYDVDTDALTAVRQRPDPSLPAGPGLPSGRIAFGYDPDRDLVVAVTSPDGEAPGETWTFDPGTGAWRLERSQVTSTNSSLVWGRNPGGWFAPTEWGGQSVFDEATGLTVFVNDASTWVEGYDAGQRAWRTLYLVNDGNWGVDVIWCNPIPPVYDSLNARIVCRGYGSESSNGVSAFSATTGKWRWLLEPLPSQ
jgi:hypothetical protein